MARPRKKLDTHGQGPEVLRLLKKTPAGWKRERLLAVKLGLENELGIREIAEHLGRAHQTVQDWFNLFREGGLTLLLKKDKGNGSPPALDVEQMAQFKAELEKNQWRTGKQAYDWLRETFGVTFHPQRVYVYLKKARGAAEGAAPEPSQEKP
jgi:transposase